MLLDNLYKHMYMWHPKTLLPTACSVALQDKRERKQQLLAECEALQASLPVANDSSANEEGDEQQVTQAAVHLTMLHLSPGAGASTLRTCPLDWLLTLLVPLLLLGKHHRSLYIGAVKQCVHGHAGAFQGHSLHAPYI